MEANAFILLFTHVVLKIIHNIKLFIKYFYRSEYTNIYLPTKKTKVFVCIELNFPLVFLPPFSYIMGSSMDTSFLFF